MPRLKSEQITRDAVPVCAATLGDRYPRPSVWLTRDNPVKKLGVADLGRTRLDILGDLVIILRHATKHVP